MKKVVIGIVVVLLAGVSIFFFVSNKNKNGNNKEEPKEYVTVKFEAEGNDIKNKTLEKGSELGELPIPTLSGYKFLYWALNDAEINENYAVDEDITLQAKFEEINPNAETYVDAFDTDGAVDVDNQIIIEGRKIKEPDKPIKEGYKFSHWEYEGMIYDFDKPVTGDIVLQAVFIKDDPNDKKPPVITLKGEDRITLKVRDKYIEPGYTAVDDNDGDITNKVVVDGKVNTSAAGTYVIKYTSTDETGKSSYKTRVIIVE